jgi:hypothetical protein
MSKQLHVWIRTQCGFRIRIAPRWPADSADSQLTAASRTGARNFSAVAKATILPLWG